MSLSGVRWGFIWEGGELIWGDVGVIVLSGVG